MAAWTVHRPSPESWTNPVYSARRRVLDQGHRGEVQQPRADDAPAPPDLGDLGDVEVVAVGLGELLGLALRKMSNPSAYACIRPYSIPLWTILTKCPRTDGPQWR